MEGYDLDDTLARMDYHNGETPEQRFANAPMMYEPKSAFVVISGRRLATPAEREATMTWLLDKQAHFMGYYASTGRDAKQVAASKGAIIHKLGLSDYTDNNVNVLAELAALGTGATLWTMSPKGVRARFVPMDRAGLARRWAPTL
jgi:hypothetical protein